MALGIAISHVGRADLPDFLLYCSVSFACVAQCLPIHKCAAGDHVINRRKRESIVVEMAVLHDVIVQDMSTNGNVRRLVVRRQAARPHPQGGRDQLLCLDRIRLLDELRHLVEIHVLVNPRAGER